MELAIVGAGAAGAAAAYALRGTDHGVTIFEKSRGVCGRAATRRKHGCTYDHGANYIKADSDRVAELVTETLPTEGLVNVEEPVWTFDRTGRITESDRQEERKWSYEAGITQLAKRLFAETDAEVAFETRVEPAERPVVDVPEPPAVAVPGQAADPGLEGDLRVRLGEQPLR